MIEKCVVEIGGGTKPLPRLFRGVDQWVFDPWYEHSQPADVRFSGLQFNALPAQGMGRVVAESTAGLILARNLLCDYSFKAFGDTTEQILEVVKRALAPDGAFIVIDDDYCGGLDTERMLRGGRRHANYTELSGLSFSSVKHEEMPYSIARDSSHSRLRVVLGVHAGFESQPLPMWDRLQCAPKIAEEHEPPRNPKALLKRLLGFVLS